MGAIPHHQETFCQRITATIQEVKMCSTDSSSVLHKGHTPLPTWIPLFRNASAVGIRFNSTLQTKTLHLIGTHLHLSITYLLLSTSATSKSFLTERTENKPERSGNHFQSSFLSLNETAATSAIRASSSMISSSITGSCFHSHSPVNRSLTEQFLTVSSINNLGKTSINGTSLNHGSNQNRIFSPFPTSPLKKLRSRG
ncbi:hypothetical protein HanIR_Chr14g0699401 [Helianthus annuus]|nr:hypothetical protein HanIR_Chr14g0699401 [Helianthus annuus]